MSAEIGQTRFGCNLQGALSTLEAIDGIVPLIHGIAGLGIQNFAANRAGNGSVGLLSGYAAPSTNIYEKQIVFGGGSRLREQIKNMVKVVEGDLYIVLSGVESEMISDDVVTMTQEIIDQGYAAAYYKAPGFRGHARTGYEEVVDTLLDYIIASEPRSKKDIQAVNLLGIVPQQDLYWQGNLEEIERLLNGIGIKANRLFGHGQTLESWRNIPNASLNLVFSKWGIKAAEKLEQKYGTPYLFIENIGLGPDTDTFIQSVGTKLSVDQNQIDYFLQKEREKFDYILRQFSEFYFAYDFRRKISIVGEESKVIRYGTFLKNYLGMSVETIIITDYKGEEEQIPSKALQEISSQIEYSRDTEIIENILSKGQSKFIFGSELETRGAHTLDAVLYLIGAPQNRGLAIRSLDAGYEGAVSILEKLSHIRINERN